MSEGLTPERQAEIRAYFLLATGSDGFYLVEELMDEIDRLTAENARLSSALDLASAELQRRGK